jgi:uncharacterized membrane protein
MKQLKLLFLLTLIALIFVPRVTLALHLEYYGIEDTINEDFTVDNSITLRFSEPISHLDYQLDFMIYNLTTKSEFESDCEIKNIDDKSVISCDFIGMDKNKRQITLDFKASNIIKKVGENYKFNVNYGISLPINRSFVLIRLPEKGILANEIANKSYYPETGKIITDGRRIMIYWENENLSAGDSLQFSVLYTTPSIVSNILVIALTLLVILVMIILATYLRKGGRGEPITSILNEDEKKIINILSSHKGHALQKVLVRETDFSKAKVSRLVKNLKERGVVDIEPVSGRENRIILKLKGVE